MTDLSSAAFSAATAVALSPDERRAWFQVLGGLDPEPTWDLAAPALTTAAAIVETGRPPAAVRSRSSNSAAPSAPRKNDSEVPISDTASAPPATRPCTTPSKLVSARA